MGDLYVGQSYHLKLLCKQAYRKNQESWPAMGACDRGHKCIVGKFSFKMADIYSAPILLFDNKNAHWTG